MTTEDLSVAGYHIRLRSQSRHSKYLVARPGEVTIGLPVLADGATGPYLMLREVFEVSGFTLGIREKSWLSAACMSLPCLVR